VQRRNEEKGTRNEEMKILAPLSWFLVPSLKRVGFPGGSRKGPENAQP